MAGRSVSSQPHARHVLPSPLIPARALAQTCAGDHPQQAHARHDRCGAHACGLHHVLRLDSAAQGVRALVPSRIQPPSARATLRSRLPTRWPSAESMVPIHAHVGTLTPAATALCAGPWGARASGGAPTFTPRTFTPHGTHGRGAELERRSSCLASAVLPRGRRARGVVYISHGVMDQHTIAYHTVSHDFGA